MNTHALLIDNLAFAKKNESLSATLSVQQCPRLAELLKSGEISYSLTGNTNTIGQHTLSLLLNAKLTTECQRCLGEMPLVIELRYQYLISAIDESELEDSDDIDLLEPNQSMNLLELIEDEVMTALPIAPAHEGDCSSSLNQGVKESGEKPNPFAVLKGLIKP